jgi:hypothetical protein
MKIPDEVRVGPHPYQVILTSPVVDAGRVLAGLADHDQAVITLDNNLTPSFLAETFLHELLHCIAIVTGTADRLDEALIGAISPTLYDTLERNGLLHD